MSSKDLGQLCQSTKTGNLETESRDYGRQKLNVTDNSMRRKCGPGPVNLGGELTVRHSALLVVDDTHSRCYNL